MPHPGAAAVAAGPEDDFDALAPESMPGTWLRPGGLAPALNLDSASGPRLLQSGPAAWRVKSMRCPVHRAPRPAPEPLPPGACTVNLFWTCFGGACSWPVLWVLGVGSQQLCSRPMKAVASLEQACWAGMFAYVCGCSCCTKVAKYELSSHRLLFLWV